MSGILVIDNDPMVRHTLRAIFEWAGFGVHEAPDGIEGLRCYKEHAPDLVITDIVMPGKNGLDTIRELRSLSPSLKLIAITGSDPDGRHGYLKTAEDLGVQHTFAKPFDVKELMGTVKGLLGEGT